MGQNAGSAPAAGLDRLAGHVAEAVERGDPPGIAALRALVLRLEELAGAGLGDPGADPPVVLARRFARAHRQLRIAGRSPGPAELRRWADALSPSPGHSPGIAGRAVGADTALGPTAPPTRGSGRGRPWRHRPRLGALP